MRLKKKNKKSQPPPRKKGQDADKKQLKQNEALVGFGLRFQLQALEPFHSGNGLGKLGVYDAGQQSEVRDGQRIPIIRDDTVRGLLKDACRYNMELPLYQELWRRKFDADPEELFAALFDYALGDSVFVTALRPVAPMAGAAELFKVISRTAVDEEKRRAKARSLRSVECACEGLTLEAEIRGRIQTRHLDAAKAFLKDGIQNMRRLGGSRNRGWGAFGIGEITETDLARQKFNPLTGQTARGPIALLVTVEAVEPLHISAGTQIANLLPGLPYISGSTLLGAMRHEWRLERHIGPDKIKRHRIARLLSDPEAASFGDLLPLPKAVVSLKTIDDLPYPAPLSWQYPKGTKGRTLKDRQVKPLLWNQDRDEAIPLKRLENIFVCGERLIEPRLQIALRNQVTPGSQRVEENSLFTVESNPAGTRFGGCIWFETREDFDSFMECFGDFFDPDQQHWLGIGRGRKPAKVIGATAVPLASVQTNQEPPQQFSLHLVSHCTCRNELLQYCTELQDVLAVVYPNFPYRIERRFERVTRLRKFTPVGGLPDFPMLAIEAGSSYLLSAKPEAEQAELTKAWEWLEQHRLCGIGEHTSQGLGRFILESTTPVWTFVADAAVIPTTIDAKREAAIVAAEAFLNTHGAHLPSASQWNGLLYLLEGQTDWETALLKYIGRPTRGGEMWARFRQPLRDTVRFELNTLGIELLTNLNRHKLLFLRTLLRYRALKNEREAVTHANEN